MFGCVCMFIHLCTCFWRSCVFLCLCALMRARVQRGQTPLHLAAESDHSEVVQLFLRQRPELATLANMEGATCTHIAAAKGSLAVTRELLSFSLGGAALCSKVRGQLWEVRCYPGRSGVRLGGQGSDWELRGRSVLQLL